MTRGKRKYSFVDAYWRGTGIYRILNLKNLRPYYGSTENNFWDRFRDHRGKASHGKHPNKELQADWDDEWFVFEIIEFSELRGAALKALEQEYIDLAVEDGDCVYNEAPANLSDNKGCTYDAEFRRKVSEGQMGHPVSEETKARISAGIKEFYRNNPEALVRASEVRKGVKTGPRSPDFGRRQSERQRGVPHSEARRKAMSEARSGVPQLRLRKAVVAVNQETGEVIESDSLKALAAVLGVGPSTISQAISGPRLLLGVWMIKKKAPVTGP